jgi:type I restriction enzyme M protein
MFIRDLDKTDDTRQKVSVMLGSTYVSMFQGKERLKWSALRDKPAETMYQTMQGEVFPFIKKLNGKSGTYAKYMADAIFKVPTPQLLEKIVTALDELYDLIDKQPDDRICDPACGTSGFLVAAGEYLKEHYFDKIF